MERWSVAAVRLIAGRTGIGQINWNRGQSFPHDLTNQVDGPSGDGQEAEDGPNGPQDAA